MDYVAALRDNNRLELLEEYTKFSKKYHMRCMECRHEFTSNIANKMAAFKRGSRGCPECTKMERYGSARKDNISKLLELGFESMVPYDGRRSDVAIPFFSNKCGHVFNASPNNLLNGSMTCTECNGRSTIVRDVDDAIDIIANTFNTIGDELAPLVTPFGRALLYSVDAQLAFFVLPIDVKESKQKIAYDIQQYCNSLDIRAVSFFQDEWNNKRELIIAKMQHMLGMNDGIKIGARKLNVVKINTKECCDFLDKHHIQGADKAAHRYGAYYNDELVAVMTFSKPRVINSLHRTKKDGMWELSRFATNSKYRVVGVASKLLKHFEREHNPTEVYSYADKRWSVGNLYHQMGFELTADNPPQYFYNLGDGKRRHRWGFRKDVLKNILPNYDENLTEEANMEAAGYFRIWDCGTLKYTKTYDML